MPRDEPVTRATLPSSDPAGRTSVISTPQDAQKIARMATSHPTTEALQGLPRLRGKLTAGGRMNGFETFLIDVEQWAWIGWLVLIALFLVIEMLTLDFTFLMLSF